MSAVNKLPLHLLLIFLFFTSATVANSRISNYEGEEIWCVAKNNAENGALQTALDWACGPGSADCRPIQEGGVCFEPEDVQSHASYAFNDYFLRHGSLPTACDFSGTAAIIGLNPSHGDCKFPASSYASNGNFSGSSTGMGPHNSSCGRGGGDDWSFKFYVVVLAATATARCIFR